LDLYLVKRCLEVDHILARVVVLPVQGASQEYVGSAPNKNILVDQGEDTLTICLSENFPSKGICGNGLYV
jgi:hypothetical protein